tara:strand:- start:231 stop:1193 length:963 start_codon:yes stop_codon:yes gene_type:complete
MKFTTSVPIIEQEPKIDHHSKILLLGSCFVENIGEKLGRYHFETLINPFGIFYHPKAIETFLEKVTHNYVYTQEDIFFDNEHWHCFDAHSRLNSSSQEELLTKLNSGLEETRIFLKKATHIVLTFGTSWYYNFINSGKSVANCHKVFQKKFQKKIFSTQEITEVFNNITSMLLTTNSSLNVLFTISPVRHLRDGFIENQQSKAHLLSSMHEFLASQKTEGKNMYHYFPAYEIMLDELRDYRFYAEDMLHPNKIALDYIWSRFIEAWVSQNALSLFKEIDVIHNGLAHRAFNENSESHQLFLADLKKKIELIKFKIPAARF